MSSRIKDQGTWRYGSGVHPIRAAERKGNEKALMEHYQEDQYSHYRVPRSRKKRERCGKLIQTNKGCECP